MSISAGTKNNGFTLIEVLVAVALTALLLTALYSAFFSIAGAGATANKASVRYSQAGRFLDRFAIETRSAYYRRDNPYTLFEGDRTSRHSEVAFTSFTFPQGSGDAPGSDLIAVRYSIEKDGERRHLLKEVWSPYTGGTMSFHAVEEIGDFEVSFYNGRDWSKAWDAKLEGKTPKAVRVKLTLANGEELVQTTDTMIR